MSSSSRTASRPTRFTPESPAALGYRMPAEWEPHTATWLSWPHPEGASFPDSYEKVMPTLAKMVEALATSERVCINVCDAAHEAEARRHLLKCGSASHVTFYHHPVNEPWCRDHGPIFLTRKAAPKLAVVDWGYNAWGCKYPPFEDDDAVPTLVAQALGLPVYAQPMILEGGSIDINGAGSCITTKSCLLHPNRNPSLTQAQIEQNLRDYLGVSHFIWLGDGVEGDDTDGHVDDLTRFVSHHTIVTVSEEDENDNNCEPLQQNLAVLRESTAEDGTPLEIHTLPMPRKIVRDGLRLPASYANFYIANTVVLLPVFADSNDRWASAVLQQLFPTRKVVPIDCRELIWGLGAFHCLTQQQPALP